MDYGVKKMNLNGTNIAVNFFDTSGDDCYAGIRKEFYKDSQGIVLLCDLSVHSSVDQMKAMEKEMKPQIDALRAKVHVVGCKADLEVGKETRASVEKWAKANGYEYYEVSNVDGSGVNTCFFNLFLKVINQVQREKERMQL